MIKICLSLNAFCTVCSYMTAFLMAIKILDASQATDVSEVMEKVESFQIGEPI